MTVQAAIAFTSFLLEDDDVFTFYQWFGNFANHLSTFNGRSSDFNVTVGIDEKHLCKFY